MIKLHAVSFSYPASASVFEDFNWHIGRGESWTVLGTSGCGKSTLLYLLAGLQFPQTGTLTVDDRPLLYPRPRTGLILQDYGLLPWATVKKNVDLGLRLRRFYGPDGKHAPQDDEQVDFEERSQYWIDRLGLTSIASKFPGQISGGQRQRVAIARTLALKPDILLMDEPFSSLDVLTRDSLHHIVFDLQAEQNLTTVIVTHSIDEAVRLGRNILVLNGLPNRHTSLVSNPLAGPEAAADATAYADMCEGLRSILEVKAS